jgi:hypothetical protein
MDDKPGRNISKMYGIFKIDWFVSVYGSITQNTENKDHLMMQGFVFKEDKFFPCSWTRQILNLQDEVDKICRFPKEDFDKLR